MEKIILFIEENPQLLTVVELLGKILLCILGILIYRRTGKVINVTKKDSSATLSNSNPVSVEDLEEFAVSLSATVDKIQEIRERKK